jgi:DNA-binding NarL/FixJ family response regulator
MDKSPKTIRILIADDHPIFRDGLRRLLETERGFQVVGEAADGLQTIAQARQHKPDILLLDLAMPRMPGLETLRELASAKSPVRTILLTAAIERAQIVEALQLGARGVVMKESATELLLKSIRSVMDGEYWVGRECVHDLVETLRQLAPTHGEETRKKTFGLTPRELEIITAIVAGYTNKDIAQKFSISEQTVKHHLTNIFDKLGVSNRLELALFAVNHGLGELP